jgi:hypothetical protein
MKLTLDERIVIARRLSEIEQELRDHHTPMPSLRERIFDEKLRALQAERLELFTKLQPINT